MTSTQSTDSGVVALPASMQTLLDRYTERTLTVQERLVLAHATPNVRCEALRIFFEKNDAAVALEYVLANNGASPRSHGGSARASRSGSTATAVTTPRALQSLSANTIAAAASAVKERIPTATATAAIKKLTPGVAAAPSPVAKLAHRPRRTSAARREESVCTLVTVSSMSSTERDDDEDGAGGGARRWHASAEAADGESAAAAADMPPTTTRRTHTSCAQAGAVPVVPTLALDVALRQRHDCTAAAAVAAAAPGAEAQLLVGTGDVPAEATRKTVAAKWVEVHADPAAAAAPATAPAAAAAACHGADKVEPAPTELSYHRSSPSPSCAAPSMTSHTCNTDWAALIAAAARAPPPPPPLPVEVEEAAAVTAQRPTTPTSPRQGRRTPSTAAACATGSVTETRATAERRSGGSATQPLPLRTPRRSLDGATRASRDVPLPPSASRRASGAAPGQRGVAWDASTGTYITHPNQRRRQLLAAKHGGGGGGGSDGTAALETPAALRACFVRTASAAAPTPTPFARLRSAVSAVPPPPPPKVAAQAAVDGASAARTRARPAAVADTPSRTKRTGAATRAAPPLMSPPPAMVPIVASPRLATYQRLRSGHVPERFVVHGRGGEGTKLQRLGSQHPPPRTPATAHDAAAAAAAAAGSGSPSKLRRIASATPATPAAATAATGTARLERYYSMMRGGGVEVVEEVVEVVETLQPIARVPCPSAIRTPRSTRCRVPPPTRAGWGEEAVAASPASARGSATATAPVPPAHCSVFERLSSNYYDVYASATALESNSPPPPVTASPRGGRVAHERHQPPAHRRRHVSAPAGSRRPRRAGASSSSPAVTRQVRMSPGELVDREPVHTTAPPASNVFARSNTSRYLLF
ncbi:hypothetical protein NESM_000677000 [Novymonas esmeraldas]|uniref:Uncharacterized protein n=1 Tax=Novymonas esmeraldas TaxID=1808958 RepID=A0AAW0EW48_9TRYP